MLDKIDEKILTELQQNAKATMSSLAKRISTPVMTVHNRVKKLEKTGIIKTYKPVLDYAKLGRGIGVFITVVVAEKVDQEQLVKKLRTMPNVERAIITTGASDVLLEAYVPDVATLHTLLIRELRKVPGVLRTQTMMMLQDR